MSYLRPISSFWDLSSLNSSDPFLDATTHLYMRSCPSVCPSVPPSGVILKWRKTLRPVFRWRRNFIWPKRKSKTFQKWHQNVENTTVTMDIMIPIPYSLHMTFLIANTLLLNTLNFEHRPDNKKAESASVCWSVRPSVDLFVHPMLFLSDKNWGFWEKKVWR